ncbi:AraC family transcriptional regulator [Thalassospira marina]|uniref:AraC family transcriptional regulator CmrA n=1 Tax=Thalassospira marina TaxID=2048283 RepID=A0A2N3KSB8_9PROT|nr:AraC family transcriptional regulator [Thalassospira marina]AUG52466.1 AraC family transcriptional regulator CmrA [Thalassospira marina]PKR53417.1 AraC family transcriptional regulator CmrA [Thalassospira marina]
MTAGLDKFARLIEQYCPSTGRCDTDIPGVVLLRADKPMEPVNVVYQPSVCILASGEKTAMMGESVYVYRPGQYLTVSLDVPVLGEVTVATPEKPYLCLRLDLNTKVMADILMEARENNVVPSGRQPGPALQVSDAGPELIDASVRMLELLATPRDIPILAPLIEREILYRLLNGPQSVRLQQLAMADSKLNQVSRAIEWIKKHFREPFSVEVLAREANMSASALHQHFKAITSMSPLQYQKQLRLQEARSLIMVNAMDAASAGYHVGYDSPSQFSREYRRMFGAPPRRDVEQLRLSSSAGMVEVA